VIQFATSISGSITSDYQAPHYRLCFTAELAVELAQNVVEIDIIANALT
jgi:hypothetical protein